MSHIFMDGFEHYEGVPRPKKTMYIGDIRRKLFMPYDCAWNGYIRDMTAQLEDANGMVNIEEAFMRINSIAALMMELRKKGWV